MYVYLIYDKATKLTKIGKSKSPKERIKDFAVGNPLAILFWYSDKYQEKYLHDKFSHKLKYGEWFNLNKLDYLDIIGTQKGLPKSLYYKNKIDDIAKKV